MTRDEVLRRFSGQRAGRRGYVGEEAIETRIGSRGDHSLVPGDEPPGHPLTPAAVLVPLVDRPNGFTVLLTQRTQHLTDHAGQISFPGGRIEASDPNGLQAGRGSVGCSPGRPPAVRVVLGSNTAARTIAAPRVSRSARPEKVVIAALSDRRSVTQ